MGADSTNTDDGFDVVIVGGGPAGCSAAVFTARYGLDTVVFDRGNAALDRCAYLENYLGFPAGVDVDTFHDLMHTQVAEVGAQRQAEMVESVSVSSGDRRFVVETQQGSTVGADHVIAAAWYDGSYLRDLDHDDEMFVEHDHHGETTERFDPAYADEDGRTPTEGLYVASPAGARSSQAIVAAGNGAHVARALIEDLRRQRGLTGEVAPEYDWQRPPSEFSGEWAERDRWREWFENEMATDEIDDQTLVDLRETYIDRAFATELTDSEVESRTEAGLQQFVEVVGEQTILDTIDDETIRDYLEANAAVEHR